MKNFYLLFVSVLLTVFSYSQGDDCANALDLGALPTPETCGNGPNNGEGVDVVNNLTNVGAIAENPYNSLLDCQGGTADQATPAADVWVTFVASGQVLDITMTSGLAGANISIYQGTTCGALNPLFCTISNNGSVAETFSSLVPGEQYFMQISGEDEVDTAPFTLTLNNYEDCSQCAQDLSLTATPPPVNGVYQPGTTVEFCMTVGSFEEISIHWLHGISPLGFGPGWDETTLVGTGVTGSDVTWVWEDDNSVPQAGYYVDSDVNGSVDDNFGDNDAVNITACWEITTVSDVNCVNGESAGLNVETYSDGETGSYTSGSCTGDPVTPFNAIVSCCDFPLTSFVNPSCDNIADGSVSATGQGGTAPYDYSWEDATGAVVSTDNNLADGVASTSAGLLNGTYTVTVTDFNGCEKIVDITIAGPPCPPCFFNGISANAAITCPSTTYSTTGVLTFQDAPSSGTLTVTDCNGNEEVFNAPFTSPQNYTLTGQTADGLTCDITAVFSADVACTITTSPIAPICPCVITNFNIVQGDCIAATDTYSMSGTVTFDMAPTTGVLTVSVDNGTTTYDTVINVADFISPLDFSISGIPSDEAGSTITAVFSADAGCTSAIPYTAPPTCACDAEIGTFSTFDDNATNTDYVLCFGDSFNYQSNGDYTPPADIADGDPYNPGIGFLIYSCPPTPGIEPVNDLCFEGLVTDGTGALLFNDLNNLGWINAYPAGTFVNNTIYYVPITMYDIAGNLYSNVILPNPTCYDLGPAVAVQYLPEIKFLDAEDCQAGSITTTINGGLPEIDGSNFTAVPGSLTPVNASFDNTTAANGGTITISGLTNGQNYSYNVVDDNGCPIVVSGTFIGTEDPGFNYDNYTICTEGTDPVVNITGDAGTFSFALTAGVGPTLSINTTTGAIDASASDPGTYDITYTTNDATCFSDSVVTMIINLTPIVDPELDQTVCADADFVDINFTGTVGATFDWTNDNTTIGLGANGTGDILAFTGVNATAAQISATITVIPTLGTCVGLPITFDLSVDPLDNPGFSYPVYTYCTSEGDPTATIDVAGGAFTFAIVNGGPTLVINATTGLIDLGATDAGSYDITYTTGGACPQDSTVTMNIAATPTVDLVADQTVCNGADFALIDFTGSAGTTFNWVNDNVAIGLAANGVDDILAFTATNGTAAQISSTITVTPVAGTCTGTPTSFDLFVDPLDNPGFSFPAYTYCTSEINPTAAIDVVGGVFTFTINNGGPTLVINAATGLIDLGATDPGSYDITYTTVGVCPLDSTVTMNIAATPTVDLVVDQTVCDGFDFTLIDFTGSAGSTFNWVNDNVAIGLVANGTNDIAAFTAVNGTTSQISSTITVTPVAGSCTGTLTTFELFVDPLDNPGFSYPDYVLCTTDANPTANIDVAGGVFTFVATTGGPTLVINAATGLIDLGASDEGVYDITYTTNGLCVQDSTISMTVNFTPTVDVVTDQTVCDGTDFTTVVFTGTAGSVATTYDWTNDDVSIGLGAAGTGSIVGFAATNSTAVLTSGLITVTPSTPTCTGTATTFNLNVTPMDNPGFSYPAYSYCSSEVDPAAIIDVTGGSFSFSATTGGPNLAIDVTTGLIDLDASNAGVYNITYTTAGLCPQDSTIVMSVASTPAVDPIGDQTVCHGQDFALVDILGSVGSVFNWTNDNVTIGLAISGVDDIASFTGVNTTLVPQTGVVVVTPSAGSCVGETTTFNLTVNPLDNAGFNFPITAFCTTDANPIPSIDVVGGTFTSFTTSGAGNIDIDPSTGEINLANSDAGSYDITYTTVGPDCPQDSVLNITINLTPIINSIADQLVCEGNSFFTVDFTGSANPTFTWTNDNTNIGLAADGNGDISSFVTTTAGGLEVANITVTPLTATCVGADSTFVLSVDPLDNPGFGYAGYNYCTADLVDPSATIEVAGGTFTYVATAGGPNLVIDATTGLIDLDLSDEGIYDITYTTAGPCVQDSTVSLTINFTPVISTVTDQTICHNTLFNTVNFTGVNGVLPTTYDWTNDNTTIGLGTNGNGDIVGFTGTNTSGVQTTGIITVIPSTAECIGLATTFNLNVDPIDVATFEYVDGLTYCASGAVDPTVNITGTTGGSFAFTINSGGPNLAFDTNTGNIDLSASDVGSYDVKYQTNGVCPALTTLTVVITDAPIADFTSGTYCVYDNDEPVTFINGGSGGLFTAIPVGLIINPLTGLVDIDASVIGVYTITNTIDLTAQGCALVSADADIAINGLPVANITGDVTLCQNDPLEDVTINFVPSATSTGPWTVEYAFNDGLTQFATETSNSYTIAAANFGDYSLVSVLDETTGCSQDVVGMVSVDSFAMPYVKPPYAQEVCEGLELDLFDYIGLPAGVEFVWATAIDIGFGTTGVGNIPNFIANNPNPPANVFTVNVTAITPSNVTVNSPQGCIGNTEQQLITINPSPTVNILADRLNGCAPTTIEFTDLVHDGQIYDWTFGDGGTGSGNPLSHTYEAGGLYDVGLTVTSANGCVASDEEIGYINITSMPIADFSLTPQITDVSHTEIEFTNESINGDEYEWDFGDETELSNDVDPTHVYADVPNQYAITLWVFNNDRVCKDSIQKFITINDVLLYYVPNVFTPDQDAYNETFKPIFTSGFDPFDYHLMIFNRWGEVIFESHDTRYGWDGTYPEDGKLCADGVYVWKISFAETMSDKRHDITGHVSLLK